MEKKCCTCGVLLPIEKFSGRRGSCRECERTKYRHRLRDQCGCGRFKHVSSQLCFHCRERQNQFDPNFEKLCRSCGETKTAVHFGWRMKEGKKRIRSQCKACGCRRRVEADQKAGREAVRDRKRRAAAKAKEKENTCDRYRLKRARSTIRRSCKKLGLAAQAEEIANAFTLETKCAICGGVQNGKGRLHVDHCHEQGLFRGFLCSGCNCGLGLFKDDVGVLQQAIDYLIRSGIGPVCAGLE